MKRLTPLFALASLALTVIPARASAAETTARRGHRKGLRPSAAIRSFTLPNGIEVTMSPYGNQRPRSPCDW